MGTRQRSGRRLFVGALVSLGLVAAACSSDKDKGNADATTAATAVATTGVAATTAGTTGATSGTVPVTTVATSSATTPATVAPSTSVAPANVTTGGSIVISGESEAGSPWTPADVRCDSYCYQRALTFFDPVAVLGADRQAHPFLAQSITPNADSTQFTIKVRPGINFTDGTALNADAMIQNLQTTGNSLLIGASLLDLAKVPDPADATKQILKIDKVDDMTFTLYTGENGDPNKPIPWPGFPLFLTGQFGLIASPAWLDAVAADPSKAAMPIGTGPFVVQSYAPNDSMVVVRNPAYWLKDSAGRQLPYLDKITFRVIGDGEIAGQALQSGDIDAFSTSNGTVIADFRKVADQFPMVEQDQNEESNFYLMDLTKPPFDDARIRCALAMSIDRQEINDATDGGVLEPANGVFSPGKEGYLADNGFNIAQDVAGAKALVDQYKADHPGDVTINFGTTTSATNSQRAELLKGYWEAIGLKFNYVEVPQDSFISNAVFGVPEFQIYGWRQYAGTTVDTLNHWWNSRGSRPDGQISLNFPRLDDPQIDADLAVIRSTTDSSERVAKSEDINRIMAKQCYFIPETVTLWGTPHKSSLQGLGEMPLADGQGTAADGAGTPGQFWTPTLWVDKNA